MEGLGTLLSFITIIIWVYPGSLGKWIAQVKKGYDDKRQQTEDN